MIPDHVTVTTASSGFRPPPNLAGLRARMRVPQAIAGLLLLAVGYYIGRTEIDVLAHGSVTSGRVVGYKQVEMHQSGHVGTTTQHLVVEYALNGRPLRFVDRFSTPHDVAVGAIVPVLYLPNDTSAAMIDRKALNWIPWGFLVGFGLLISVSAWFGWIRDRLQGRA